MIAVARQIRTSVDADSADLKDREREELRQVDPLREIDLPADDLEDALEDPLVRIGTSPKIEPGRIGNRAAFDVLEGGELEEQQEELEERSEEDTEVTAAEEMPEVVAVPEEPPEEPLPDENEPEGDGGIDAIDPEDVPDEDPPPQPEALEVPPPRQPEPLTATGSEDLAAEYQKITPTDKAYNYKALAPKMDDAGKQEQDQVQESAPEYHATLKDQTPLPPDREPVPADTTPTVDTPDPTANVESGRTGRVPEVDLPPTRQYGRFQTGDTDKAFEGVTDEGGSDKRRAVDQALRQVPDRDGEVQTTPGAPPTVPLSQDTDPKRATRALQSGVADSDAARRKAQQQVVDSPGQELVQPVKMDESQAIGELKKVELEPPPEVGGVDEYMNLGLPGDVQTRFDEKYGPEMEANLDEAKGKVADATSEREASRDKELAEAEKKQADLQKQAQEGQDEVVEGERKKIRGERKRTMEAQNEQVQQLHQQAEGKKKTLDKDVSDRVRADEAKIKGKYADAEHKAKKEVAEGERKAKAEKEKKKKESEEKSWWEKAVDAVTDFVSAIAEAVTAIFDAVRSAVTAILDAVKEAANAIIDAATSFITAALDVFAKWLKKAIEEVLAKAFPKLAKALVEFVDAAVAYAKKKIKELAESLKKGIAALCDAITAALDFIIAAWKAAVDFALMVLQAALTGDWDAVLKKVLEAVLSVCGIDPKDFYKMIGTAEGTVAAIVKNPGKIVGLAIDAAALGFKQFQGNFLDHLQKGLINWLTGESGDMGIKMPKELNLAGVFDIVLQVLGLSKDKLRKKAVKLIGEKNVERIEWVWSFVEGILEKATDEGGSGLAGLWDEVEEYVGNIWVMVIDGIKNWLLTRIVMKAVMKLAMMFNPIGAIVQLVLTVWNLFQWLQENVKRIWGVVTAWVSSITDFVSGNIKGAADKIETALAGLIPIAISLLANLIGLKGIGKKVRKVIDKIQDKIDKAIDKLIDRIKALFPKKEGADAKGEAKKDGDKIDLEEDWKAKDVPYGATAEKQKKLEELDVHGKYKLEVSVQPRFERLYKRGGAYDTASLHKKAKQQAVRAVATDIAGSGDAMFGLYGDQAYDHYGREGKARFANAMAEDGLKVKTFEVDGKAPQGKTPEEVGNAIKDKAKQVGAKVKEKVIDPVNQKVVQPVVKKAAEVTEPVRKKIAETWEKAKEKGAEMVQSATAPVVAGWNKTKDTLNRTVIEPAKKKAQQAKEWAQKKIVDPTVAKVEAAKEWTKEKAIAVTDKVMGPATKAMNKVEQVAFKAISATVKPLQTLEGWADKAEKTVDGLKKKVKKTGDKIAEDVRGIEAALSYDDNSRKRLKQIAAEEQARLNKSIDGAKGKDAKATDKADDKANQANDKADKDKKKEDKDKKKEPAHGWDHPDARGILLPRVHFVARAQKHTLQVELGGRLYISVSGPRSDARAQVSHWRSKLNDLVDPAQRSRVASALKDADRALGSFQALVAQLDGLTADDDKTRKNRRKVANAMTDKRDALRDPFIVALQNFKSFEGVPETDKKKKDEISEEDKEKQKKEAEDKKKESPAKKGPYDDPQFRQGFGSPTSLGSGVQLWADFDAGPVLMVAAAGRAPLTDKLAAWTKRLNDIGDGKRRGEIADKISASRAAVKNFDRAMGDLSRATGDSAAAVKKRDGIAKKVTAIFADLRGTLPDVHSAFQGNTRATLERKLAAAPDKFKLVELLIEAKTTEQHALDTPAAQLRREGRELWRARAGDDATFLKQVALKVKDEVAERKLREIERETAGWAVAKAPMFHLGAALRWLASEDTSSQPLYAAFKESMKGRNWAGLGEPAHGLKPGPLHRVAGADSLYKYNISSDLKDLLLMSVRRQVGRGVSGALPGPGASFKYDGVEGAWENATFRMWLQTVARSGIKPSTLSGRIRGGGWWTPEGKKLERSPNESPNEHFANLCRVLALAPEWYPYGLVKLHVAGKVSEWVRPTVWDGMMSPLWVQHPEDVEPRTGGGAVEFINKDDFPVKDITDTEPVVVDKGLTDAILAIQKSERDRPERWTEGGSTAGGELGGMQSTVKTSTEKEREEAEREFGGLTM